MMTYEDRLTNLTVTLYRNYNDVSCAGLGHAALEGASEA